MSGTICIYKYSNGPGNPYGIGYLYKYLVGNTCSYNTSRANPTYKEFFISFQIKSYNYN